MKKKKIDELMGVREEKVMFKGEGKEVMKQDKKNKKVKDKQETLIGENTIIIGNVQSEKTIRVEGKIDGNILAINKVIIGSQGFIKGKIEADSVYIYGRVEGDIIANELLEIMGTGKLSGDCKAKKLSIHEGAIFSGMSYMEEAKK